MLLDLFVSGTSSPEEAEVKQLISHEEDAFAELGFTLLHKIILGMTSGSLVTQLDLDDSLIDALDSQGATPLYHAARQSNVDAVRVLLQHGAKPQQGDRMGVTPLHLAAWVGSFDCAKLLLEAGAPVMACDSSGYSPLHYIWELPAPSQCLVKLLIQRGAEVNAGNSIGNTALHTTALDNHLSVAVALLANGADLEAHNTRGEIPLLSGILGNAVEIVDLFLENGARIDEVDTLGYNVLHDCALHGNLRLMQLLLSKANLQNVDGGAQNHVGYTPLDLFYRCRPDYVPAPPTAEEEAVFKALLARAGSSRIEEISGSHCSAESSGNEEDAEEVPMGSLALKNLRTTSTPRAMQIPKMMPKPRMRLFSMQKKVGRRSEGWIPPRKGDTRPVVILQ